MSSSKPLVCYLFTKFDKISSLTSFVKNYKKFATGHKHDLVICYKMLDIKSIERLEKKANNLKHFKFVDNYIKNDWDFGSYSRVARKYQNRVIFFMNSHSYPVKMRWLKIFMKHYKKKTIISSSGSFESITNQVKFKRPYNIFSFLKKKIKGKNSFFDFPNPHLNTSCFLINAKDFLSFIKNKKFTSKYDTWKLESGFNSLTNTFKRKGYKLLVVNSDGNKFEQENWMMSETFHYKTQSKNLISDKHSRKYLKFKKLDRIKSQKAVWGV